MTYRFSHRVSIEENLGMIVRRSAYQVYRICPHLIAKQEKGG
jgi:hypothetical protein